MSVPTQEVRHLPQEKSATKTHGDASWPPGQRVREQMPRFGFSQYAHRFPRETQRVAVYVSGRVANELELAAPLLGLPRCEQVSDFHCVTTWSCKSLRWSGVRFADFYRLVLVPRAQPQSDATVVLLRGQDGYRSALPLGDLLRDDVLLADTLNGEPLSVAHGAPLRLVAPAHYGYKNVKHLSRLQFLRSDEPVRRGVLSFLDHPRARVQFEERGRWLPGWFLRYLYRPTIGPNARLFARALPDAQRPQ